MHDLPILETPWHLLSSMFVFFLGLYYAIAQRSFDVPRRVSALLYLWHTGFCIYFLIYSLSNSADSTGYYRRSFHLTQDFGLSTIGIDYLTSIFSNFMGMSYLGVFLVYNLLGFIGLLALAAALREVTAGKKSWARYLGKLLPFLPGASFWSASIGKDSLTFMAIGILTWVFLRLDRRYPAIAIAMLLFLLARPYMAALLLFSLLFTVIVVANIRLAKKIGALLCLVPVAIVALYAGASMVGLTGDVSLQNLNDVIEYRQSVNMNSDSSIDISSMNIVMRLFVFMFRPLFFDASGLLGLVASFENLLVILLVVTAGFMSLKYRSNMPKSAFWFSMVYIALAWLLLANTTSNLGLALRQKWMFLPLLLIVVLSISPSILQRGGAQASSS